MSSTSLPPGVSATTVSTMPSAPCDLATTGPRTSLGPGRVLAATALVCLVVAAPLTAPTAAHAAPTSVAAATQRPLAPLAAGSVAWEELSTGRWVLTVTPSTVAAAGADVTLNIPLPANTVIRRVETVIADTTPVPAAQAVAGAATTTNKAAATTNKAATKAPTRWVGAPLAAPLTPADTGIWVHTLPTPAPTTGTATTTTETTAPVTAPALVWARIATAGARTLHPHADGPTDDLDETGLLPATVPVTVPATEPVAVVGDALLLRLGATSAQTPVHILLEADLPTPPPTTITEPVSDVPATKPAQVSPAAVVAAAACAPGAMTLVLPNPTSGAARPPAPTTAFALPWCPLPTKVVTAPAPQTATAPAARTRAAVITGEQAAAGARPSASDDTAATSAGRAVFIDVLANDDAGAGTTLRSGSAPRHGRAACDKTGCAYTPAAGFLGTDTFTYRLQNAAGTATGTVTVQVGAVTPATPVTPSPGVKTPTTPSTGTPAANPAGPTPDTAKPDATPFPRAGAPAAAPAQSPAPGAGLAWAAAMALIGLAGVRLRRR